MFQWVAKRIRVTEGGAQYPAPIILSAAAIGGSCWSNQVSCLSILHPLGAQVLARG